LKAISNQYIPGIFSSLEKVNVSKYLWFRILG